MNTLLGYDDVETKNCSSCGETFPKTKDYFPIASGGNYFGGSEPVVENKVGLQEN